MWPSPRLRTLMDESVRLGTARVPAWTGFRLPGGGRDVNLGSQRMADAVVSWLAIRSGDEARDVSGAGADEAVVMEYGENGGTRRD